MIKELKYLTKEEYKVYKEWRKSGEITEDNGQFYRASINDPYAEKGMGIIELVRLLAGYIIRVETFKLFTPEQREKQRKVAKANYYAARKEIK